MSDTFNMTDLLDEVDDTPDLELIADGMESEVEILNVKRGPSTRKPEENKDMLTIYMKSVTFPHTFAIPYWVVLPQPHHDTETRERNNRNLKDFSRAFSGTQDEAKQKEFLGQLLQAIDVRSNDGESFAPNQNFFRGLRAWARIQLQEADPKQGRTRAGNAISEFTRIKK